VRCGNSGTWEGSPGLLETTFENVPPESRQLRFRANAGFAYDGRAAMEPRIHELREDFALRKIPYCIV